jgi:hypothetical protein
MRPGAAKAAHGEGLVEPVASDRDSIAWISSASHAISTAEVAHSREL